MAVVALIAGLLPMVPAAAADPKIAFLNPSGYSTNVVISDKADKDQAVHLVAWVQSVPANPLVEFEIQPAVGPTITIDAQRVGDTWEAFASVSSLTDGPYTLRARLYANFTGPGTGSEVAVAERDVTLNRESVPPPPAADTVEISYPPNGASLGFSTPAGKQAATLIDAVVSEGTSQVRALYTVSLPGVDPVWTECGTQPVSGGLNVTIRCTLAQGASSTQVTAVAVVANNTPSGAVPNPVADASGDAHRVTPYAQRPTQVTVTPETVRSEIAACQLLTVRVSDQFVRPIPTANVDVHVVGPNDQIRFGTIDRAASPTAAQLTSGFQAPDKSHVSQQDGINCGNGDAAGRQGDHNIPGANDPQHIESTAGTNNEGKFYFALYSDSGGGSSVTAYVDEDDDDLLDAGEVSGGARVGWGQDAPPPTTELFFDPRTSAATSGTCQRIVLAVKQGGNALPSANVDVHAKGPDPTVMFCTVSDGSPGRSPDQNHVGNDDDITRHLEGETNSAGQFIFGVTSGSSGTTDLLAWLDSADDDIQTSGEQVATGSIQWDVSGDRTISIQSNKNSVRKGRRVQFTGAINGAVACESTQTVKLKAKRLSGGRFRTIATTVTDTAGSYLFSVVVKISKRYKAVAPAADVCEKAKSRLITVRAT